LKNATVGCSPSLHPHTPHRQSMTKATTGPWLLYAIVDPARMDRTEFSAACGRTGLENAPLSRIDAGSLHVVVSRIADSKRIPSASVQQILTFKSVIDAVFCAGPVIPLRFGTLVPSPQDAATLVAEREKQYLDALERLSGHVEMGLSIVLSDDDSTVPNAGRGADTADLTGPGTSYLLARKEARARDRERVDRAVTPFMEALSPLSMDVSSQPGTTSDAPISLSFLVPHASVGAFRDAADAVACAHAASVDIVGPWPPYSFV